MNIFCSFNILQHIFYSIFCICISTPQYINLYISCSHYFRHFSIPTSKVISRLHYWSSFWYCNILSIFQSFTQQYFLICFKYYRMYISIIIHFQYQTSISTNISSYYISFISSIIAKSIIDPIFCYSYSITSSILYSCFI